MKKDFWIILVLLMPVLFYSGCATKSVSTVQRKETSALESVVGAISGKDIGEKELRDLDKQIRENEEARSAVEAIANTMQEGIQVKYCPVTGIRYSPKIDTCPIHNVKLEEVNQ